MFLTGKVMLTPSLKVEVVEVGEVIYRQALKCRKTYKQTYYYLYEQSGFSDFKLGTNFSTVYHLTQPQVAVLSWCVVRPVRPTEAQTTRL